MQINSIINVLSQFEFDFQTEINDEYHIYFQNSTKRVQKYYLFLDNLPEGFQSPKHVDSNLVTFDLNILFIELPLMTPIKLEV